jgi:hypothetical protein
VKWKKSEEKEKKEKEEKQKWGVEHMGQPR